MDLRGPAALALLSSLALSGCAGDLAGYPDQQMLPPDEAPVGYTLLDLDSAQGDDVAEEYGMARNPGPFDLDRLWFDGHSLVDGTHATAYGKGDDILLSFVLRFADGDEVLRFLDLNDACHLYSEMPRFVSDGRHLAWIQDQGATDAEVAQAEAALREHMDGIDPCLVLAGRDGETAHTLYPGENAPFDLDSGERRWYTFEVATAGDVRIEVVEGEGDSAMALYDGDMALVEQDDDGGQDLLSRIERRLDAGRYSVVVEGYAGESLDGVVVELAFG